MTTVRSTSIDVQTRPTASRTTAPPRGRRFRDALGQSAQVVAQAVGTLGVTPSRVTAPTVGASSSALSNGASRAVGAAQGALSGAGAPVSGTGTGEPSSAMSAAEAAHAESSAEAMELLELQRRISAEQVQFSTLSNVLKARHETAKSVVSNIR